MYLISWDPQTQTMEASLGGHVTTAEARVLAEELEHQMTDLRGEIAHFIFDCTKARKVDTDLTRLVDGIKAQATLLGTRTTTVYVPETARAVALTTQNLQNVLEGREAYRNAA